MHKSLCGTITAMRQGLWFRFVLFIVSCFLASASLAYIPWFEGYVFGNRFTDIYDEIEQQGWLKDWLEDDSDLILIDVTGTNLIVAVSAVTDDWSTAKRMIFEQWSDDIKLKPYIKLKEPEEDGGSLAIGLTSSRFGAAQFKAQVNLQSLREYFPGSFVFLRLASGMQTNLGREPDLSSGAYSYWRLDGGEGDPKTLSLQGPDQTLRSLLLALLLSLTLPMIFVGRLIAESSAKKHGFKTLEGRQVYAYWAKILTVYIPYGAVGVICFLSVFGFFDLVWALQNHSYTGTALAYPTTALFILTHLTIVSSYRNKKIFGPDESEERAFKALSGRHPLVVKFPGSKIYSQLLLLGYVLFLFGILLCIINPDASTGYAMAAIGVALIIFWVLISRWIRRQGQESEESKALIEKANGVLSKFRDSKAPRPVGVTLLKSAQWPKYYALASKKGIFMTPDLISDFSDDELALVAAHEFAHGSLGHVTFRLRVLLLLIFVPNAFFIGSMIVTSPAWAASEAVPKILAGVWASLVGYLLMARIVFPRQEFEADAEAARMVGSGLSALTAYPKLVAASEVPGIHQVDLVGTHPPLKERIARLTASSVGSTENKEVNL